MGSALLLLVACGGATEPVDCSAAKCVLTAYETHKPLPDPPLTFTCTVDVQGCEADRTALCTPMPYHAMCGL